MKQYRSVYSSFGIFKRSSRLSLVRNSCWQLTAKRTLVVNANDTFDEETDVLIVGSGAGGLTAALRAKDKGLEPLVIEKSDKIGGSSAYSGGVVWVPNNAVNRRAGVKDTPENALKYLNAIIGDVGPASSAERRVAFLEHGPKMIKFLEDSGFQWVDTYGYPDYFPEKPGGQAKGRAIEPKTFNVKTLGEWEQHLLINPHLPALPIYAKNMHHIAKVSTFKGISFMANTILFKHWLPKLFGRKMMTNGHSLAAQLLLLNVQRGVPIWRETKFLEMIVDKKGENSAVVGALVSRNGRDVKIKAKRGVLIAAGGFAHNKDIREKHGPKPATTRWSLAPPSDTGDAILAGIDLGAKTDFLDDAWWGMVYIHPKTGKHGWCLWERSLPHGIMVDSSGQRFMNESQPYTECGHSQYGRHKQVPSIPAWLVIDSTHRKRYVTTLFLPGITPQQELDSGYMHKANTLEELAEKIGVNVEGLVNTVSRFNQMAAKGVDEDFGRGNSAYDNFLGDPRTGPNPNLGALESAPYYAIQLYPGDIGTKGGFITDENGRVVHKNGDTISNLYASGNSTASVMGHTYPGPGGTLGPSMTFAFRAIDHMAGH